MFKLCAMNKIRPKKLGALKPKMPCKKLEQFGNGRW